MNDYYIEFRLSVKFTNLLNLNASELQLLLLIYDNCNNPDFSLNKLRRMYKGIFTPEFNFRIYYLVKHLIFKGFVDQLDNRKRFVKYYPTKKGAEACEQYYLQKQSWYYQLQENKQKY